MAYERTNRITVLVSPAEQKTVRLAAAEVGVSLSEFTRVAALGLARRQVLRAARLPGIDEQPLPDWVE